MYRLVVLCVFLFELLCSSCENPKNRNYKVSNEKINTLSKQEKENGWKLLFDGRTTNGWRGFQLNKMPNKGWSVENGNLVCLGKATDIITVEEFENFDLQIEWKISKGGNSGILYHVLEQNYNTIYETGPEYQIIDDYDYPKKLKSWQKTGADHGLYPPENAYVKPIGEYNYSRIISNNGHVEHWLNGVKVVDYNLWSWKWKFMVWWNGLKKKYPDYGLAKKGHIALQAYNHKVWFRNIKIKELN